MEHSAMWKELYIKDPFLRVGVTVSSVAHLALFAAFAFNLAFAPGRIQPQFVYSVTLEGGKNLGGISQAPKDKNKSQLAPPKKVQEPKKVAPKKSEPVKVEKKAEPEKAKPVEEKVAVPKKVEKKVEKKEEKKAVTAPKETPKKAEPPKPAATKPVDIDKKLQQAVQRYTGESTAAGGVGFGAGRLGGESFGGGIERPPEFFEYKRLLEDYIKSGWRWFDPAAKLQAQVEFELSSEGEIQNVTVSGSSGVAEFDESVIRAVKKANPVPAPPETVYEFFRKVRITFDPGE